MSKNRNLWNSIQLKKPKKSKFDLTHDVKMSCNMGELVPICNMEVLPGDSFTISNQNLIRMAPMIAPVMHRVDVYVHYFFVPNRILWANWEKFITNDQFAQTPPVHPTILYDTNLTPDQKRMAQYFGLPEITVNWNSYPINAFPFAAYNRIYNDYYRDENLDAKLSETLSDGANNPANFLLMQFRAWEHDYFTSALPWAQKGASVSIPMGSIALDSKVYINASSGPGTTLSGSGTPSSIQIPTTPADSGSGITSNQLFAQTKGKSVNPTTINDLRRATRLQEWLEKNARAGTRYVESLLSHFFVKAQDERLQRSEYIGGAKSPLTISEVLNTTGTTGQLPQGNMAGHGIGLTNGNQCHYHAQEHGWIIGIMSVLPKPAYQQGIDKSFFKSDFLDYAWPEFANIGEQPVYNKEIYAFANANPDDVFGYVPRYSEYKYIRNRVAGQFMNSLDYWHLGRKFATPPALNSTFIKCTPTATSRIFAVTDPTVDHLYCQVVNNVSVVRALPFYGTPAF